MTSDSDRDGPGEAPGQEEHDDVPGLGGDLGDELDVDTAFAEIVAGWAADAPAGIGPWPASEDVDPEDSSQRRDRRARHLRDDAEAGPPAAEAGPTLSAYWRDGGVDEAAASDPDRFVPPDPPPLPRGDLLFRLAWAGVIGGPLFLVIAVIFWPSLPQTLLLVALMAFVGGFVTLVARMPGERGEDDDDGAVV